MEAPQHLAARLAERAMLLDGGLATELERRGHDLHHPLWSARLLAEDPDAIRDVHAAYLAAGAECITTAAYQASLRGFREQGCGEADARRLYLDTLRLARAARDAHARSEGPDGATPPLVAASIGPFGAYLADGSEFRGAYRAERGEIERFHRERIELLAEAHASGAGPDLLAIETIPSLDEALLVCELLREHPAFVAWVSFSCVDGTTCEGQPIEECGRALDACDQVVAIGVNCTAPRHLDRLLEGLRSTTEKPLVCYPNSGETFDPATRSWTGTGTFAAHPDVIRGWLDRGARLLGGCCRTTPEDVRRLGAVLS